MNPETIAVQAAVDQIAAAWQHRDRAGVNTALTQLRTVDTSLASEATELLRGKGFQP